MADFVLTITIKPVGAGGVTLTPRGTTVDWNKRSYEMGTLVVITYTSHPGYMFSHWEGDVSGSGALVSIVMDANKQVTAVFEELPSPPGEYVHLTTSIVGDGEVRPSGGKYPMGSQIILIPDPLNRFDYWSGDASGTKPVLYLAMDKDKHVIAHFRAKPVVTSKFTSITVNLPVLLYTRVIGSTIKVAIKGVHEGTATTDTLYCAVGHQTAFGFDEVSGGNGSTVISVKESIIGQEFNAVVEVPLPRAGVFDIYAKIGWVLSPVLVNKIRVLTLEEAEEEGIPLPDGEEGGIDWWLWGGITVLAVIIVAAVVKGRG